ncbi:hypothetical protein D3C86_1896220 [compost metagenome]
MDSGHFVRRQFEVEDVEALAGALDPGGARDGDDALLDEPAQGDLTIGLAVSLGDLADHRVVGDLALGQRRPGRDGRAQFARGLDQGLLRQVGVVFDLVGDQRRLRQPRRLAEQA